MKTKLLLLSLLLCTATAVYSQSITVIAPPYDALVGSLWAPNGSTAHTTYRTHFIVPASELVAIPTGTTIDEVGLNIYLPPAWSGTGTPAGNLQIYLENTSDATNMKSEDWNIAIASMTSVYNAPYTVPAVAGTIDLPITSPFVYNGGGIYVAYDYVGTTFTTQPIFSFVNDELSNSCWFGASNNTTPLDSLDNLSNVRPEFRFTFVNQFTNNLTVSRISPTYGTSNSFTIDNNSVDVEILNIGTQAQTNIPVTLELVGGATYSTTQSIASIGAGGSQVLTFTAVPSDGGGADQVIEVHFPADQQSFNDTLRYIQNLSCTTLSYVNSDPLTSIIGLPAGTTVPRIYGVRYDLNNALPISVKSIDFSVSNTPTAVGNTVKGILLNSAGVKVDSTAPYNLTSADLGQIVSLPLINASPNYAGQTIFAGVRLSTPGVNSLCIQDQLTPPQDRNFTSGPNGGTITYQNGFAPLMISIGIEPRPVFLVSNTSTGSICAGVPVVLTTFPTPFDNYTLTANGNTLQTNATGIFNESPIVSTTYEVESEKNGCFLTSSPATVTIVSEFTSTQFEDVCSNTPFDFNGQLLNVTGQYIDTLAAVGGCDSIITLNLNVSQVSESTLNESICEGDSYDFNGQILTASGTYTDVLLNAVNCDSTVTLNLDVTPIDLNITNSGGVLTVAAISATVLYQWIDCETNLPIAGQDGQSLDALSLGLTGNYAVEVTQGNCVETSPCLLVDFTGIEGVESSAVSVYPNPVANELFIKTTLQNLEQYSIFDATGKRIQTGAINSSDLIKIDVSAIAKGTYILELTGAEKRFNTTFVK